MPKRSAHQAFCDSGLNDDHQVDTQSRLTLQELYDILQAIEATLARLSVIAELSTPPVQIDRIRIDRDDDERLITMFKKMRKAGVQLRADETLLGMIDSMLKSCEDDIFNHCRSPSARRRYRKAMSQIRRLRCMWRRMVLSSVYGDVSPRKKTTSCREQHAWGKGC